MSTHGTIMRELVTEMTTLDSICRLITDGKHGDCRNEEESGYFFLSAKDVKDGKLNYENARQIAKEDFLQTHRRTQLEPLDILVSNSGTIGRMAIAQDVEETYRTTFQKSVAILKPDKNRVDPYWLYYYLHYVRDRLINTAGGTAQSNLLLRDLRSFEVEIYPRPIQRKISTILYAYDNLIENNIRRIKILEEIARAIYREWFVHFCFPGHKNVKMMDSSLGNVPEGWEIKKFSEAVRISPTEKISRETKKPYVAMEGLSISSMLVSPTEIRTGNNGSKFRNGDTLFARITPCLENGKTGFVQFLLTENDVGLGSTEFIVFRAKTVSPEYVYLLARQEDFRALAIKSMSGASGRQRVDPRCFEEYYIAQPDNCFLESFSAFVRPIFREIYALNRKNKLLRGTREMLLPKLISGDVDVSELDINGREMNS
jgi:type I restriction enzyme S subunit